MKDITIRVSLLAILIIFPFQIYAKDTSNSQVLSNKNRLEKLELGVAKLGAKREHLRNIKYKRHDKLKGDHNFDYPSSKAIRIISNKDRIEKLEKEVAKLGAERERARIIKQSTPNSLKPMHNRTIQSIANKERLERLERGVFQLGTEREQNRIKIQ